MIGPLAQAQQELRKMHALLDAAGIGKRETTLERVEALVNRDLEPFVQVAKGLLDETLAFVQHPGGLWKATLGGNDFGMAGWPSKAACIAEVIRYAARWEHDRQTAIETPPAMSSDRKVDDCSEVARGRDPMAPLLRVVGTDAADCIVALIDQRIAEAVR